MFPLTGRGQRLLVSARAALQPLGLEQRQEGTKKGK